VVLLTSPTPEQVQSIQVASPRPSAKPVDEDLGIAVGISIGTAETNERQDPQHLLESADRAMYETKVENKRRSSDP
jgi:GGDEF domain-containing protein